MAETMSIADRIRSLNVEHVRSPGDPKVAPPRPTANKPAVPSRPVAPTRSLSTAEVHLSFEDGDQSIGNQPAYSNGDLEAPQRAEKKRLPLPPPRPSYARLPSHSNVPSLPPRRPSEQTIPRRDSLESISSTVSARSTTSALSSKTSATTASRSPSIDTKGGSVFRVPTYDPTALPPLPPKKTDQKKPGLKTSTSAASLNKPTNTSRSLPPPLPVRQDSVPAPTPPPRTASSSSLGSTASNAPKQPPLPARPQPKTSSISEPVKKSALSYGLNKGTETPPPIPAARPEPQAVSGSPPPIPTASRPNLAALQASKPKPAFTSTASSSSPPPAGVCMKCRDFSGPDNHAARFPREAIPSTDVHWLSNQLTSPFPSHTDKARAIFTWLHHNVAYNCHAFFTKTVKPSTPASTIATGLAVCEGYAGLFAALATASGLECVVIGGHGAGFGFTALGPNDPTPPEDASGHAWNVVRIDGGEWKLVEPCWGAGHLGDDKQYHKQFHAPWFTMSNNDFGLKHFPKDPHQQFRTDGRVVGWEEYIRGGPDGGMEKLTIFTGCEQNHGIGEETFVPRAKHIRVRGMPATQRIQFLFGKVCEHWDNERHGKGKPYQFLLGVGGKDGRDRKNVPFRTNGSHWWVDIPAGELGTPGQTINLWAVTTVDGKDARGLTYEQYQSTVGRKGMGFGGVAAWQLV